MSTLQLPRSQREFISAFNINSYKDAARLCKNPGDLTPEQSITWKYSEGALRTGRPFGSVVVFMAGATGSGKSSTINILFDDPDLCPTSASESETREPVQISKRLCVTEETPSVIGQFSIIDVPGTFDTNRKREGKNLASVRKFKKSMTELESRNKMCATVLKKMAGIRDTVYPNLVLFVVNANDNRISGPNSFLRQSLTLLSKTEELIDKSKPNVIIVLTNSASLGIDPELFATDVNEKIANIRQTVLEVLEIKDVDVIPVENDVKRFKLIKEGDFYKLPNGELSHYNLYQAMLKRFDANKDLLGRLLVGWYFGTDCPERTVKAEVIEFDEEVEEAEEALAALDILGLDEPFPAPTYSFQSLGYGYCPVTEEIKPMNILAGVRKSNLREVEIDSTKFLIPEYVNAFVQRISRFHRISFFEKEEYQSYMKSAYGIEAGFKLIVNINSEGRWVNSSKGSSSSALISVIQEIQVATFKVDNLMEPDTCPAFSQELNNLPNKYTDETAKEFRSFFSKWGSHLIREQAVGGAYSAQLLSGPIQSQ